MDICGTIFPKQHLQNGVKGNILCEPENWKITTTPALVFDEFPAGIKQLKYFGDHAIVLLEDGSVFSYGNATLIGRDLEKTDTPYYPAKVDLKNPIDGTQVLIESIATMEDSTIAVSSNPNAAFFYWGNLHRTQYQLPVPVKSEKLPKNIWCGLKACFVVHKDDNTLYSFGEDGHYMLGIGTYQPAEFDMDRSRVKNLPPIDMIEAAGDSSFAVTTGGNLYYWGRCTDDYLLCPFKNLKVDETFDGVSIFVPRIVNFPEINRISKISCSASGTCIMTAEKDSYAFYKWPNQRQVLLYFILKF